MCICQDRILPPDQAVVHLLLHWVHANYNSHLHIIPALYMQKKKKTENGILHQFCVPRCFFMLYELISAMCIIYQSLNSGTVKLAKQDNEKATKQQASDHHSLHTKSEKQSTDRFNKKKFWQVKDIEVASCRLWCSALVCPLCASVRHRYSPSKFILWKMSEGEKSTIKWTWTMYVCRNSRTKWPC